MSLPDQSFSETSSASSTPPFPLSTWTAWITNPRKQWNHEMEESCSPGSLHRGRLLTDHEQVIHKSALWVKIRVWAFVSLRVSYRSWHYPNMPGLSSALLGKIIELSAKSTPALRAKLVFSDTLKPRQGSLIWSQQTWELHSPRWLMAWHPSFSISCYNLAQCWSLLRNRATLNGLTHSHLWDWTAAGLHPGLWEVLQLRGHTRPLGRL